MDKSYPFLLHKDLALLLLKLMWLHTLHTLIDVVATHPSSGCGKSTSYNDVGWNAAPVRFCTRALPAKWGDRAARPRQGNHLCYGVWLLVFCVCAYGWVRVGADCPWAQNANDNKLYDAGPG